MVGAFVVGFKVGSAVVGLLVVGFLVGLVVGLLEVGLPVCSTPSHVVLPLAKKSLPRCFHGLPSPVDSWQISKPLTQRGQGPVVEVNWLSKTASQLRSARVDREGSEPEKVLSLRYIFCSFVLPAHDGKVL